MTAFAAATLHNLLLRSFTPHAVARETRPMPEPEPAETMPMLFRSEGFAEDLCDSHWFHGVERRQSAVA